MKRPTILVLATDPQVLTAVVNAAREAGYAAQPGRYHELAIDSLTRAPADFALVHVDHEGADSIAFEALAQYRGTRVLLFAARAGNPEERARVSLVSSRSRFPVVVYTGDAAELIAALEADT